MSNMLWGPARAVISACHGCSTPLMSSTALTRPAAVQVPYYGTSRWLPWLSALTRRWHIAHGRLAFATVGGGTWALRPSRSPTSHARTCSTVLVSVLTTSTLATTTKSVATMRVAWWAARTAWEWSVEAWGGRGAAAGQP